MKNKRLGINLLLFSTIAFYLLLPFTWLYGFIIWCRNQLYDRHILKSTQFIIPTISIGNLSTGGTGKTPHVEYLAKLLSKQYIVATLSRGYKRRTSGYQLATKNSTVLDIGDEPLQIKTKFPEIAVAVGEQRVLAIPNLLLDVPETEIIILDDAFQHRQIQPHLSILLTTYQNRFTQDHLLPAGNLREHRANYKRADVIIVTKCPIALPTLERQTIIQEIQPLTHQKVLFSHLQYATPYSFFEERQQIEFNKKLSILLVCGIARTNTITSYLNAQVAVVYPYFFGDHHYFSKGDIQRIAQKFKEITSTLKIIVTTEKDAARLRLQEKQLRAINLPIYCLPVDVYLSEIEEKVLFRKINVIL